MATTLIKQGRYIKNVAPVCGTNGLGTCVGLAVYDADRSNWFVAHIDSAARVTSKTDPAFNKVAEWVKAKLDEVVGDCISPYVAIIGSLKDFSGQAIGKGIEKWADTCEVVRYEWDGFQILEERNFVRLHFERNNTDGDGAFSVPQHP